MREALRGSVTLSFVNPTDTLAISHQLQGLDKSTLSQTATALATQNAQQTNQIQQLGAWIKSNVPEHFGRGPRLGLAVHTGLMVGVAYGALPQPWALVASAATAAASGVAALMANKPDWVDAALAVTAGASAGAVAIEAARGTSEFMAKRAAAKASAASSAKKAA